MLNESDACISWQLSKYANRCWASYQVKLEAYQIISEEISLDYMPLHIPSQTVPKHWRQTIPETGAVTRCLQI